MKSLFLFAVIFLSFAYVFNNTELLYYNCYYKEKKINTYPMTKLEASILTNDVNKKLNVDLICKDELILDLSEFYELRD